jgi:hypothetical protein
VVCSYRIISKREKQIHASISGNFLFEFKRVKKHVAANSLSSQQFSRACKERCAILTI